MSNSRSRAQSNRAGVDLKRRDSVDGVDRFVDSGTEALLNTYTDMRIIVQDNRVEPYAGKW